MREKRIREELYFDNYQDWYSCIHVERKLSHSHSRSDASDVQKVNEVIEHWVIRLYHDYEMGSEYVIAEFPFVQLSLPKKSRENTRRKMFSPNNFSIKTEQREHDDIQPLSTCISISMAPPLRFLSTVPNPLISPSNSFTRPRKPSYPRQNLALPLTYMT